MVLTRYTTLQILLDIPTITPLRVFQLEHTLLEVTASKKKRRDLFRDFLGEIIETLKQISPRANANTPDSIFHQESRLAAAGGSRSTSAVMNIQMRVMRPKSVATQADAINDPDFTLTSLFDD